MPVLDEKVLPQAKWLEECKPGELIRGAIHRQAEWAIVATGIGDSFTADAGCGSIRRCQRPRLGRAVRCRGRDIGGMTVTAGTPCEVQVRTLLQQAHSELTHDTIYKPRVVQTPDMHRAAARMNSRVCSKNDRVRYALFCGILQPRKRS